MDAADMPTAIFFFLHSLHVLTAFFRGNIRIGYFSETLSASAKEHAHYEATR